MSFNHSFDVHIATEYKSVEIAILVWHFHYWIAFNKRLGKNQIEGRTWTYQTIKQIAAAFPYWSIFQIERLLKKSVDLKILKKANFNKSPYDRTVWYAFENEEKFGISRFHEMDETESGNGNSEIGKSYKDKDTETDPETDIDDQKREKNDDDEKGKKEKSPEKVIKEKPNGEKIECSKKEYYRYLSFSKLQYTSQEVEEAWERFCNGNAAIGDYKKYLNQIIENMREEKCSKSQKTKKETEKKELRKEAINSCYSTLGQDTQMRVYPKVSGPYARKDNLQSCNG